MQDRNVTDTAAHSWHSLGDLERSHDKDSPKGPGHAEQVRDSQVYQLAVLGSTPGMPPLLLPLPHSRRDLDINRPGTVPNAKTLR